MATYSITFSCGHTAERQLYGKEASRARFIAWAGDHGLCPACKGADALAAIEAVEQEQELPDLTGSEKQVAWARKIRAEKLRGVIEFVAAADKRTPPEKREAFEAHAAAVMQGLTSKIDARYWINAKDLLPRAMAEAAYNEQKRA